ncbi:hypothetical protein TNCV_804811 [Trichonephila clavipes]|nr:hypothetical protein TNCV_804811 [Trichonephila clavipes]
MEEIHHLARDRIGMASEKPDTTQEQRGTTFTKVIRPSCNSTWFIYSVTSEFLQSIAIFLEDMIRAPIRTLETKNGNHGRCKKVGRELTSS